MNNPCSTCPFFRHVWSGEGTCMAFPPVHSPATKHSYESFERPTVEEDDTCRFHPGWSAQAVGTDKDTTTPFPNS